MHHIETSLLIYKINQLTGTEHELPLQGISKQTTIQYFKKKKIFLEET